MKHTKLNFKKTDGDPITNSGCDPNGKWNRRLHLFSMLLVLLMMTIPNLIKAQNIQTKVTTLGAMSVLVDNKNLSSKGYITVTMNVYDTHYGDWDEVLHYCKFTYQNDRYCEKLFDINSVNWGSDARDACQRERGPWYITFSDISEGVYVENEGNYWESIDPKTGLGYHDKDRFPNKERRQFYYGPYLKSGQTVPEYKTQITNKFWSYVDSRHSSLGTITFRIYLPTKYLNNDFVLLVESERMIGNYSRFWEESLNTYVEWSNKYPDIDITCKASNTPGKMYVGYNYPASSVTGSIIEMKDDYGETIRENLQRQGGINKLISNVPRKHFWRANIFATNEANSDETTLDPFFQSSHMKDGKTWKEAIIPAYVWPENITSKYDSLGYVNISFIMPYEKNGKANEYYIGEGGISDQIEFQRATSKDFSDAKTIAQLDYVWNQGTYKFKDDVRKENIQGKVYYRFRRTASKSKWNWEYDRKDSIEFFSKLTFPKDVQAVLDKNINSSKITWTLVERIWPEGSVLRLIGHNLTTNQKSKIEDLSIDEARKGVYFDDALVPCNRMSYSLQLILPQGTQYSQPEPIKAKGTVLTAEIGKISDLEVSKGYFADRVDLKWKVDGGFDAFRIRRVEYTTDGSKDTVTIDNINSTASEVMLASDAKGAPGVYYRYIVDGMVVCDKTPVYSNVLSAIGFRSPTGSIYGQLTYKNGQAVPFVDIFVKSDRPLGGHSMHFDGKDDYLQSPKNIDLKDEFTLQAYIYPETTANGTILSKYGVFDLEMENGTVKFTAGGKSVKALCKAKANCDFVHVSAVKKHNELRLYIDSIAKDSIFDAAATTAVDTTLHIGSKDGKSKFYRGYIDEVRIWNEALTGKVIERDYCRLLWGGEKGLQAYWRFNDGIAEEFYDLSCTGNDYHQHHGTIVGATYSDLIPTESQLTLKGVTDKQGNYTISGIPYSGQGTTYYIIPKLGTHQFEPAQHQRMMANGALSHTCDFNDKSSFEVRGAIYYYNTTIPVEGVNFNVDGQTLVEHNGMPSATNSKGEFAINVPVGYHEVCATLPNHTFVNGGKIVDIDGHNINYQENIPHVALYDSTLVKVVGRVAGGPVQGEYPLGHSLSKNNLSDNITVTFTLASGTKYTVNNTLKDITDTLLHHRPSYLDKEKKWDKSNDVIFKSKSNQVQVIPNKETGEFVAYLYPVNYNASVKAGGHEKVIDEDMVSMDLSSAFLPRYSEYVHKEEIVTPSIINPAKNDTTYVEYKDTVEFNQDIKFIQRQSPNMEFVQLVKDQPVNYFGDAEQVSTTVTGKEQKVITWKDNRYTFGKPVFTQGVKYNFRLSAFEEYKYYKTDSGKPVVASTDRVPVTDGVGNFNNDLSNTGAVDTAKVDDKGFAYYHFTAGEPLIGSDGLKNMTVFLEVPGKTISWNGGDALSAYLVGSKAAGTRFVTKGPDKVKMILRDPHGSHSYSYLEEGATITTTDKYVGSIENSGSLDFQLQKAPTLMSWIGVGAGIILVKKAKLSATHSMIHRENLEGTVGTVDAQTYTTRFQTSDQDQYVGAAGDLFIGNSTNISYGTADNLHIVTNDTYNSSTNKYTLVKDAEVGDYKIVQSRGLSFTPEYTTMFAYPQAFIENSLLPELEELRNTYLLDYTTKADSAQELANNTDRQVYVSKLPKTHKNYGASNTDEDVWGEKVSEGFADGPSYKVYVPAGKKLANDTILAYNEQIKNWIGLLELNEKEKVEAKLFKNYSFHAGSSVEYSEEYSHASVNSQEFHIGVGWQLQTETGFTVNEAGLNLQIHNEAITTHGGYFEQKNQTSKKVGFVLADEGSTDFLSVDVCRPMIETPIGIKIPDPANFVFKLKGGATSCPYEEGYVTKYYDPGQHVIDEPTVAVEAPKIKHVGLAEVVGVPSTRRAAFKIQLINNSGTKSDQVYDLHVLDDTNPNGAKFYIDGGALGNGRSFLVPYGQPLVKTLEVGMGPDSTAYKDLQLVFHSQCQYTTLDFKDNIGDTLHLSAFFVPACTDIKVEAPADNWVVNTDETFYKKSAKCYFLPITVSGYDINFPDFKCVKLKYKPSAASEKEWVTLNTYYVNKKDYDEATETKKAMLPKEGSFIYELLFKDLADQRYDICAVAECIDPQIKTISNIVSGLKDTKRPTLFGSAQPSDGVLSAGEDIMLKFNEEIAEGLIIAQNISVTGTRNGKVLSRDASLRFDGLNDYLTTEATKNFNGKNFTVEMAYLVDQIDKEMTLFSHGNENNALEIGITPQKQVKVKMGAQSFVSDPLKMHPGSWESLAVVYNNDHHYLTVYQNGALSIETPAEGYTGEGSYEIGRSLTTGSNYFKGDMSELRVWDKAMTDQLLTRYKDISLKGNEIGLLSYYPMNEGRGNVALDKARGMNANIKDAQWNINRKGRSVQFNGTSSYVALNTAAAPIVKAQDFTIEFWFKAAPGQKNVALVANGRGDNQEEGGSSEKLYIGFNENGKLVTISNGSTVAETEANYLDYAWHHYALTVQRSAQAKIYMDGQQVAHFAADDLDGVAAAQTYLGARAYMPKGEYVTPTIDQFFKGYIDDFRMWNLRKNETMVVEESNVNLIGNEMGLMAYYPFETYVNPDGMVQMDFTLNDMKVRKNTDPIVDPAKMVNAIESVDFAPIKDRGPVETIPVDWVVNKDEMIITPKLSNGWDNYEQSTITIKVSDIQDLSRNRMASTLAWTAYIDRNQLVWNEDVLNLSANVNEGLEFTVDIANIGGTVQHYSIQNQPAWLEVSAPEGSIKPKKSEQITFTVNEGLNIGTYNEVLYLVNESGVARALELNLKVMGEKPDWKVNAGDYLYNMSLFGQIRINNIFSNDSEDMLGAFLNGKCIGVTHCQHDEEIDQWSTFLSIYYNETTSQNIEFRIWDASTGRTYAAKSNKGEIKFANNAVVGPVIFDAVELVYQNIPLNRGWNWISFNVNRSDFNDLTASLLNGEWSDNDQIKSGNNGFANYIASQHKWLGTLNTLDNKTMYMLNTNNEQTLSIEGRAVVPAEHPITVNHKWNYISYQPMVNMTIQEALADYQGAMDNDIIKSQTSFAIYMNNKWVGSLKYMEANQGYMLYRGAPKTVTFKYPSNKGSLSRSGRAANALLTNVVDEKAKEVSQQFAENMSVIATTTNDFELEGYDRIVAMVNGEVRGVANKVDLENGKRLMFISISGEKNAPVTFVAEREGRTIATTTPLFNYESNDVKGSMDKPVVLDFSLVDESIDVSPRVFDSNINVTVKNRDAQQVVVAIYNLQGRLLMQENASQTGTGIFRLTYNGKALPEGHYLVRVSVDDKTSAYKVVKIDK